MDLTNNGSQTVVTEPGREYTFAAQGNFGGGTLHLEWSFDGTTWSPIKDVNGAVTFTEDGGSHFYAPSGNARARLVDATAPNITLYFNK